MALALLAAQPVPVVPLLLREDPRLTPHLPGSGVLAGTVAGVGALALAGSPTRLGGVADLLAAELVLATAAGAGALSLVATCRHVPGLVEAPTRGAGTR